ncbi:MAG: hypothetical protein V4819_09805 [Verrucomicrobiota bacterium]
MTKKTPPCCQLAALAIAIAPAAVADVSCTVAVKSSQPGIEISEDVLGLSFETSIMLPDKEGVRYFRPDNEKLITLFRTIGIKSLRIGGNSVDDPKIPIPTEGDVRSLFDFARKAGVKVMYSFRLQDGDPASAAGLAKLIYDNYPEILENFSIGNEPGYYKDYQVYTGKWKSIRDAVVAVVPSATFSGPDQNPEPELIKKMVQDLGTKDGRLAMITQHSYPFGCSYKNPSAAWKDPGNVNLLVPVDAADARQRMISPDAHDSYSEILGGMIEAIEGTKLTFRMTEVNSLWFSGLQGASDRHASALWGVDFLHWWASHGADGLNFHTGDRTGGSVNLPCRYAAFVSAADGYEVRPLSYGLKLFDLGGHGRSLPVTVSGKAAITAYATRLHNEAFVTVINRRSDAGDQSVSIKLDTPLAPGDASSIFLRANGDDLAAVSADMSLGGSAIGSDGNWKGDWTPINVTDCEAGAFTVSMPPTSAAVFRVIVR